MEHSCAVATEYVLTWDNNYRGARPIASFTHPAVRTLHSAGAGRISCQKRHLHRLKHGLKMCVILDRMFDEPISQSVPNWLHCHMLRRLKGVNDRANLLEAPRMLGNVLVDYSGGHRLEERFVTSCGMGRSITHFPHDRIFVP